MKTKEQKNQHQNKPKTKGKPSPFAKGVCNPKEPKPHFIKWDEFVRASTALTNELEVYTNEQIDKIEKHRKCATQVCLFSAVVSIIALALSALAVIAATGVIQ